MKIQRRNHIMNNNITIRVAIEKDVPLILKFIRDLAEYEKLLQEVVATESSLKETLFTNKTNAEVIIAEVDEQPVGFVLFFHNFSTFLGRSGIYLEDLFISPKARGQGVGKKVLNYIAKLAKDRNCGRLEWSVLNWNKDAINFYENLGAKPMNEWTVYRLSGTALADLARDY